MDECLPSNNDGGVTLPIHIGGLVDVVNRIQEVPANVVRDRLQLLPYRYPARTPMTLQAELRQIAQGVATGHPRLRPQPLRAERLDVVGYGPTLADTWELVGAPCITMSGSHDFLLARGRVPTYHAQTDGRDHQVHFLEQPHAAVTYVMATVCPPAIWPKLADQRVLLWHNAHGKHVIDWIAQYDRGAILVAGGSTIGLSAIHLGGILGYRRFRLVGVDGHYRDGRRHAGPHHDPKPQRMMRRRAGGRLWETSEQMANACDELLRLLDESAIEIEIVGDSLQAALVDEYRQAQEFWRQRCGLLELAWKQEIYDLHIATEMHRSRAAFNTGALPPAAACVLRALARWAKATTAVEIGTFIGMSTLTLAKECDIVYTCDERNNCLPAQPKVERHPGWTSTQLLAKLADQGIKAGLFFIDGRLRSADLALLLKVATPDAVFVVDDYVGAEKGIANVELLAPQLAHYALMRPAGRMRQVCTLAALVPQGRT